MAVSSRFANRWQLSATSGVTEHIPMVEEIADERGHKAMARNMLGHAITLFNWAFDRDLIEHSPCDRVRASKLIGEKKPRKRVLSDAELFAMWRASGRLGYPFGPLIRLLMLTGTRRNEAAGARWREFDLGGPRHPIWTIPPARFKSDATHLVPVTDDILAVLDGLPQFKSRPGARVSDHLFSTTNGERPVSGYSKAKQRLDTLMLQALKAAARRRGDDPSAVELAPFVVHDIRRTVRTRLSALRVPTVVAEMVIGHGLRGIQREYDQHEYLPEKREALEAWAAMLRGIVEPTPANVVRLDGRDMNTGVSA